MLRCTLVFLAGPFLMGAETPAGPEKTKTPAPATKQAVTAATPGMVVVKDPESGLLRAPNGPEAASLGVGGGSATSGLQISAPQAQAITSPVGGFPGVRLNDTANVYSVATIGPDGKLKMACIDDKKKAESAVKGNTGSKPVLTIRKEAQLELQ